MYVFVCILYKPFFFRKFQHKLANVSPSFAGNPILNSGKVLIYPNKELKRYGLC